MAHPLYIAHLASLFSSPTYKCCDTSVSVSRGHYRLPWVRRMVQRLPGFSATAGAVGHIKR